MSKGIKTRKLHTLLYGVGIRLSLNGMEELKQWR
jgi:hypothetical protein